MKKIMGALVVFGFLSYAQAEETISEKASVMSNNAKRSVKKTVHQTKEALCGKLTGDSKAECLAKQAKNRIEESAEAVKDKAIEIKNKVDTDTK